MIYTFLIQHPSKCPSLYSLPPSFRDGYFRKDVHRYVLTKIPVKIPGHGTGARGNTTFQQILLALFLTQHSSKHPPLYSLHNIPANILHSRRLRSAKYFLQKDVADKNLAINIDGTCHNLNNKDSEIGLFDGVSKIDARLDLNIFKHFSHS